MFKVLILTLIYSILVCSAAGSPGAPGCFALEIDGLFA